MVQGYKVLKFVKFYEIDVVIANSVAPINLKFMTNFRLKYDFNIPIKS